MTVHSGTTESWHYNEVMRQQEEARDAARKAEEEAYRLWEHEVAVVRHHNATRGFFTPEKPEPRPPLQHASFLSMLSYLRHDHFRIRDAIAAEVGHHGWRYMEAGDL